MWIFNTQIFRSEIINAFINFPRRYGNDKQDLTFNLI